MMLRRRNTYRLSVIHAAVSAAAIGVPSLVMADSEGNVDNQVLHQTIQPVSPLTPDDVRRLNAGQYQLLPSAPSGPHPRSVTDATWTGGGASFSWQDAANWSTGLVPDGAGAIARFGNNSGGPVALLGGGTVTLDALQLGDPVFSAVAGGTIVLTGSGVVSGSGSNVDLPSVIFNPIPIAPNGPFNNIGGAGSFTAALSGSVGVTKTGDSPVEFDSPQFHTGTTTISGGGKIITSVGDAAFGTAGNAINLNGGSIQVATADWTTSRNITVSAGGGSIHWVGASRVFSYSGNISGSGSLQLNGAFGAPGAATITTAQSFTGTLNLSGGSLVLTGSGAMASVAAVRNGGTLNLDNASSGSNVDRLSNTAPLTMRGAAFQAVGGATNYNETVGPLNLDGGASFVTVLDGGGGAQVNFGNVTRSSGAAAIFRGNNLGQAPGSGNSNIFLNNGTSLLVKGLIPFAWANPSFSAFTPPESPDNTLVTYDGTNGVVPITAYDGDFSASTVNTNVRLTGNTTVTGDVNCNALVIAAPGDLIVPNGAAAITVGGTGTIHVDSGVLLSAHAGFFDVAGNPINSFPGNVVTAKLDFGTREAVIMTPSAITLNGVISGTGGLTKVGGRTAQFAGANTYTGTTTLNGFNRFVGDVPANGTAGPFGMDTSAIILYGGNTGPINPGDGALNGSALGQLGGNSTVATTFSRPLDVRGDNVFLRNFGTATVTFAGNIVMNDPATVLSFVTSTAAAPMVVTGAISGAGRVEGAAGTFVHFMSANTNTGGYDLEGTWSVGNDNAFSTGSLTMSGAGTLIALGAPRTLNNKIAIFGTTLNVAGPNPLTFAGEINGRLFDYLLNVTSTATTTFSGTMTGGGFFKTGSGVLVVSGNNTFPGTMNVGNGATAGGLVILRSNGATGSTAGVTGVNNGNNALALDGGITIGEETLFLRGDGTGAAGSLRNLSGNNTWGGVVRATASYNAAGTATVSLASQSATIGVDAGSLTVDSTILSLDTGATNDVGSVLFLANSIGVHKLGPGALIVGSDVLTAGTNTFNGAIVASGSLDIQNGMVQIKPNSGAATISGGKSVTDVASISIAGGPSAPTAKLDLTSNSMVIDYTGGSPIVDVRNYIKAGFNSGAWTGNGITSSKAATSPNAGELGKTALGYGEASTLGITSFLGDPLDATAVIVKYTYFGDADLDGDTDGVDIGTWAVNFTGELGGAGTKVWTEGDWDYDGDVDGVDAGLWATSFTGELGGGGLGSIVITEPIAPGAAAILESMGITVVPEPVGLGVLGLAGYGLLAARRPRASRHR